jgi:hypothetical protein
LKSGTSLPILGDLKVGRIYRSGPESEGRWH